MEKLLKNPAVLIIGVGVLSFFATKMILNRREKMSSFGGNNFEPYSNAGGCTCSDGTTGYCAGDCATCCARKGGVRAQMSRFDAFEPSSNACGCGM